jgi:hypothetical protein
MHSCIKLVDTLRLQEDILSTGKVEAGIMRATLDGFKGSLV